MSTRAIALRSRAPARPSLCNAHVQLLATAALLAATAAAGCAGTDGPSAGNRGPRGAVASRPVSEVDEPAASPAPTAAGTEPDAAPQPAAEARACGSRGLPPCADDAYCDFPDDGCGAADRPGSCRPRPRACTREFMPVCGCDGRTYPTACVAASQGVDVARPGPCDAAAPPAPHGGVRGPSDGPPAYPPPS